VCPDPDRKPHRGAHQEPHRCSDGGALPRCEVHALALGADTDYVNRRPRRLRPSSPRLLRLRLLPSRLPWSVAVQVDLRRRDRLAKSVPWSVQAPTEEPTYEPTPGPTTVAGEPSAHPTPYPTPYPTEVSDPCKTCDRDWSVKPDGLVLVQFPTAAPTEEPTAEPTFEPTAVRFSRVSSRGGG
jgi:hypothetical protein